MTPDSAAIDLEQGWALLLELRRVSRTLETLPARLDLGLDGAAPLVEVSREGSWTAQVPVTEAGAELLDLYLPMALACRNRPLTVAHLGQSLDGRIATLNGASCPINGPENLTHLHRMRALCDAIIVGASTVECDNPQLTTRRVTGPHPVPVFRLEAAPAAHLADFDRDYPKVKAFLRRLVCPRTLEKST